MLIQSVILDSIKSARTKESKVDLAIEYFKYAFDNLSRDKVYLLDICEIIEVIDCVGKDFSDKENVSLKRVELSEILYIAQSIKNEYNNKTYSEELLMAEEILSYRLLKIFEGIKNYNYNIYLKDSFNEISEAFTQIIEYLKKTSAPAEEVFFASDDEEAYKEQDMDIKISENKSTIDVDEDIDELFNYLLGVEGLVDFIGGSEELNEIEVKKIIKRFIDHYRFCIKKMQEFKYSIIKINSIDRNKSEESIKIFVTLKGYILEDKIDFCYKAVDALTVNQARGILDRFIYEYSGVKRSFKELM